MKLANVSRLVTNSTRQGLRQVCALALHDTFNTPGGRAFCGFVCVYLFALLYCSCTFNRDPTSAFFDPRVGYERLYSVKRQEQALSFIAAAEERPVSPNTQTSSKLCLGISTIGRPGEQYVRSTIGSLLEGLNQKERRELYLITFIAETHRDQHPIFDERWPKVLSDEYLPYNVSKEESAHLEELERSKNFREKGLWDYRYVLNRCISTGAPYVAILDDDVLAVAGWFNRTMTAVDIANARTPHQRGSNWLYLRLFYTEEFFGFNRESWPLYLLSSVGVFLATGFALVLARMLGFRKYTSNRTLAVVCGTCVPACIILYFLIGRNALYPLASGVHQMQQSGCCGQGLLYPRDMAISLVDRLHEKGSGFPDSVVEEWANENSYIRWAVVPSLLQHIGGRSSKGDDFGGMAKHAGSVAEKIWSFAFEQYR
ncbi:MAG: hypothetical protein Q9191_000638 [Dirinaria sp. TL-2023a]